MEQDDTLAKVLFQAICDEVRRIDPSAELSAWDAPGADGTVIRETMRAGAAAVEDAITARRLLTE